MELELRWQASQSIDEPVVGNNSNVEPPVEHRATRRKDISSLYSTLIPKSKSRTVSEVENDSQNEVFFEETAVYYLIWIMSI